MPPPPLFCPSSSSELEPQDAISEDDDIRRYLQSRPQDVDDETNSSRQSVGPNSEDLDDELAQDNTGSRDGTLASGSRRNEAHLVGRLARRRKLHPYQIADAENLTTVSISVSSLRPANAASRAH